MGSTYSWPVEGVGGVVRRPVVVAMVIAVLLLVVACTAVPATQPVTPSTRSKSSAGRLVLGDGTPPVGDAVPARKSSSARYAAIEGSPTHLVYAMTTKDSSMPFRPRLGGNPSDVDDRFVLRSDGRIITVPRGWDVGLMGDTPLFTRPEGLNGIGQASRLRWRLPEQGKEGVVALDRRSLAGPSAGGVLESRFVGSAGEAGALAPIYRLILHRLPDGPDLDLGIPHPDGAPYATAVSADGLLTYSAPSDGGDAVPDGQVRYRAWDATSWRTLNPGAPARPYVFCDLARVLAVCQFGESAPDSVFRVANGTKVSTAKQPSYDRGRIVTDGGFIGITGSTLMQSNLQGQVVRSPNNYDRFHPPVIAFGRIIVDETGEHRLLALAHVDARPKVVVGR